MSHIRLLCWIVAASLVPVAALAQDAAADRSYTLVMKGAVGDLVRYKTQTNMKMVMKGANGESPLPMPPETSSELIHRVKTVAVKPDGSMVQVTTMESGNMKVMGQSIEMPATPPITMEVDRFGRAAVRSSEKLPGAQILNQFMNMNQVPSSGFIFPDHPVKIGDSWQTTIPAPSGAGKMQITSTLLGTEEVGGRQTLKIKQVTELPLDLKVGADQKPAADEASAAMVMKGNIAVNSIANIMPGNGRLVKAVGDIDMKMQMTLKGDAAKSSPFGDTLSVTGSGTYTMSLLSEGKVSATTAKPASSSAKATAPAKKKVGAGKGK